MSNYVQKHSGVISTDTRSKISTRYKKITKSINMAFWNSDSDTANSFYVGSYGRNTAISTSDIDILVVLPDSQFDRFNNLMGNTQSRLLQAVKNAIVSTYPNSDIKADGQVVKINFSDGIKFEIIPAFKDWFGIYKYPDSNMGGNWKSTNPKAEQEAIKEKNQSSNGLLVATCRHMRYIRDNYFKSYHLSGIVIDSFVYSAIGDWKYIVDSSEGASPGTYERLILDYFINNKIWGSISLSAPGSGDSLSTENSVECLEKVLRYMAE